MKKNHDACARGEHVVSVRWKDLQAGLLQLHPHGDRPARPDDPRPEGKARYIVADVLVIGGIKIAAPSDRMIRGVCVSCAMPAAAMVHPFVFGCAPLSDAEKPAQSLGHIQWPAAPALAAQVPFPNQNPATIQGFRFLQMTPRM